MNRKLKAIGKEVYLEWNNKTTDEEFMKNVKDDLANNYNLNDDEIHQIVKYIDDVLLDLFNKSSILDDLKDIIRLDEDINILSEKQQSCQEQYEKLYDLIIELNQKYELNIKFDFDDNNENTYKGYYIIKEYLTNLLVN